MTEIPQQHSLATAFRTLTEQRLAALWSEVLESPIVDGDAHFVELGGNSFDATRVIARVGTTFAVHVRLRTFFHFVTLREQATEIDRLLHQTSHNSSSDPEGQRVFDRGAPTRS